VLRRPVDAYHRNCISKTRMPTGTDSMTVVAAHLLRGAENCIFLFYESDLCTHTPLTIHSDKSLLPVKLHVSWVPCRLNRHPIATELSLNKTSFHTTAAVLLPRQPDDATHLKITPANQYTCRSMSILFVAQFASGTCGQVSACPSQRTRVASNHFHRRSTTDFRTENWRNKF
jgi:hypothetical protein